MHYEGVVVPSCPQNSGQCRAFHWKRPDRLPDVRSLRPVFLIAGLEGVAWAHRATRVFLMVVGMVDQDLTREGTSIGSMGYGACWRRR